MKKEYYTEVTVTEKRKLRVVFRRKKKPTKAEMLEILKYVDYDDIIDEQSVDYISVDDIEYLDIIGQQGE